MARDISPDLQRIRLFLTEQHPCSYLSDQLATTAFIDPDIEVNDDLYGQLSRRGFRRSGKYIYTPRCENCNACTPVRIQSDSQKLNRQQRRCLNKNEDLSIHIKENAAFEEHFPLYDSYIRERHSDGDMFPPTPEQYQDFISAFWPCSRIVEFRLQGKLIAATVTDILADGLSAIYTYFSTEHEHRSLGTLAVLTLASMARESDLPYVYLGYWIKTCPKMAYKTRFRPIEMYINGHWVLAN